MLDKYREKLVNNLEEKNTTQVEDCRSVFIDKFMKDTETPESQRDLVEASDEVELYRLGYIFCVVAAFDKRTQWRIIDRFAWLKGWDMFYVFGKMNMIRREIRLKLKEVSPKRAKLLGQKWVATIVVEEQAINQCLFLYGKDVTRKELRESQREAHRIKSMKELRKECSVSRWL